MYKLVNSKDTNQLASITKNDDSGLILSIPINTENSDYQQYLAWVAEGNTVLPADENNDG